MQKVSKTVKKLIKNGVIFTDPQNVIIEEGAKIGSGTIIYPYNYINHGTVIGCKCVLYSFNFIENSIIGDECHIGPFCRLRTNSVIAEKVRLGNFVEVKNSTIGNNTKAAHLSYIGDAKIGKDTNIGCGVVFANYDGVRKHKTTLGNNCFVGCNTNLIAPLTVGDNCFIAAGTTLNKSLEPNTFAIARAEEKVSINKFKKEEL